ncbi:MAG: DUF1266 domain-containing protein [Sulfurovum sp.]|nr:DUF1266 domain-containing protein [Sulfurovum sp.]
MNKEEEFALGFAKLETQRLKNTTQPYEVERYLTEEFSFNINDDHASTKVYYVLKKAWTEGVLEVFIRNNILRDTLEVKDLVAFDAARFVKLVLEVLKLKLIEEKEAWGLLFLNAQRVQDTFDNAKSFTKSFLKGALFYDILFQSDEEDREEKVQRFDALFQALYERSEVALFWLEEEIFTTLKVAKPDAHQNQIIAMQHLLAQEDKTKLWELIDSFTQEERNASLHQLYVDKKSITAEDYLELPALYPDVSYAHYLRAVYFYHYAWEARGLGLTNTVGQKNYALFYERLRYARADLKKAYALSPHEQTYWAELYNLVKHFKNKDSDHLEEDLYTLIKENAMDNAFCIQRVSHMKKARWGGSHQESLAWAREVVAHSSYGNSLKIILFEVLIEQYKYIVEYDKDEEKAEAIFANEALQKEVNQYFDELLEPSESSSKLRDTLLFWYEKVGDVRRLEKLVKH